MFSKSTFRLTWWFKVSVIAYPHTSNAKVVLFPRISQKTNHPSISLADHWFFLSTFDRIEKWYDLGVRGFTTTVSNRTRSWFNGHLHRSSWQLNYLNTPSSLFVSRFGTNSGALSHHSTRYQLVSFPPMVSTLQSSTKEGRLQKAWGKENITLN